VHVAACVRVLLQVKARSSEEECVVAQLDQWYLDYGEATWRGIVEAHMHSGHFETFDPLVASQFDAAVAWLSTWACSRWFGLGTKLPWDPQFVIESLSDSTIYMYAIAPTCFLAHAACPERVSLQPHCSMVYQTCRPSCVISCAPVCMPLVCVVIPALDQGVLHHCALAAEWSA
jgi:hypothetical protein